MERGGATWKSPSPYTTIPQMCSLTLTTSRSVVAMNWACGKRVRIRPIISLNDATWSVRSVPPASGPSMPRQSWKSSSLPMRMSHSSAISMNASRSSASRPFQNVAR